MNAKSSKENKMAVMHPAKLLLNMGLPMMLSMISLALYNFVDTYFVSTIPNTETVLDMGDKAVNAVTLAHPIQTLIISCGVGIGIGINTFCASKLGKNDRNSVSYGAGNTFLIAIVLFLIFLLFGIFGSRAFIYSQTADPVTAEMGVTYLSIVTIFSLGTIGHMCLEKFVMATGRTVATMVAQLTGAIVNIILDPILIFGFLGLPALGIAGAAIATVIGQFVSLFIITFCILRKCPEIDKGVKYVKPNREVLSSIFKIAAPAIAMQLVYPVKGYGMNLILGRISPSTVTALGVYNRLEYFITMLIYGLNNACIPSTAFNRGQGNMGRVKQIIKYGQLYGAIIMALAITGLQIFAEPLVGLFNITDLSHNICVTAIRIITCGYFFLGSNILLQGTSQALGKGMNSLYITLVRGIVVILPLAYLLSTFDNAHSLVWIAVPVAEFTGWILAVILTITTYKRLTRAEAA